MKLLKVEAEEPPSRPQATSQLLTKPHSPINALSPVPPRLGVVVRMERAPLSGAVVSGLRRSAGLGSFVETGLMRTPFRGRADRPAVPGTVHEPAVVGVRHGEQGA